MIAASHEVGYIHEPFQVERVSPGNNPRFDLWFTYICDENAARWQEELGNQLNFRFRPGRQIASIRRPRQVASLFLQWARALAYRAQGRRALMKDPIALFSAEWLARTFDMDVLVLIRHPAAFAGSLKVANWPHPFDHFLRQPLLMDHHLAAYRSRIEEFTIRDKDIVDRAILLWNLIHHMIRKYRDAHPDWLFVRHEDLSADPVPGYQAIFERLGVTFTTAVEVAIRASSESENPNPGLHDTVRDSKANIYSWRQRLTEEEIQRIKHGTREIAPEFYTSADWGGK